MRSGVEAFFTPFLQLSLAARTPMDNINGFNTVSRAWLMLSILNKSSMTVYWLLLCESHTAQPPARRPPTRECHPFRHGVSASETLVLGILRVSCQPCERGSFSPWWRSMDPLLCTPRWKPCATPYTMMKSSTSLPNCGRTT